MLLIITSNHFDLTWRRPWRRAFEDAGKRYVSYADIEEWYMLDNLELARADQAYAFEVESSAIAREFLLRHPERRDQLRSLVKEGRFLVTGGGHNIIDSNLVLGESIVRNFVSGLLWAETELGCTPKLGVRTDAFGNSAQIPQIMSDCGLHWAKGFAYSPSETPYWRGVDGSVICNVEIPSAKGQVDLFYKHRPCPHCNGRGCDICNGRGIDASRASQPVAPIDWKAMREHAHCKYVINPEESLPNPQILEAARRWAEEAETRLECPVEVRFGTSDDQYELIKPMLDRIPDLDEADVHPGVELNPNNSGTWVTRIKTKQVCRRQEYALLSAEAALALTRSGGAGEELDAIRGAWQKLLLTMFHDAVTATMVDPAYDELTELWKEVDVETSRIVAAALGGSTVAPDAVGMGAARGDAAGPLFVTGLPGRVAGRTIRVWNPTGFPVTGLAWVSLTAGSAHLTDYVLLPDASSDRGEPQPALMSQNGMLCFVANDVPAWGSRTYRLAEAGGEGEAEPSVTVVQRDRSPVNEPDAANDTQRIENDSYSILADDRGLLAIYDRRLARNVSEHSRYRPGELVIEQDIGSPWATLSPDRPRIGTADMVRLVDVERRPLYERLTFALEMSQTASGAMQAHVEGTLMVTLYRGLDRVDFDYELEWSAFNARLRLAVPTLGSGTSRYGVPYAALERGEYEPDYGWAGANGDWPATDWAGVDLDGYSVALLTRGTPSYCHESSLLSVSLLRSPTVPTYLHDPHYYEMTQFDGMRDTGRHRFSVSLVSSASSLTTGYALRLATGYNAGLWSGDALEKIGEAPSVESEVAYLAAIKPAEDGSGDLILRIVEYAGRGGVARLAVPSRFDGALRQTNMLERDGAPLHFEEARGTAAKKSPSGRRATIGLRRWEIATVRLGSSTSR